MQSWLFLRENTERVVSSFAVIGVSRLHGGMFKRVWFIFQLLSGGVEISWGEGGFDSKKDRVYRSGGCYLRNHLMLIYQNSLTQTSCYLKYFLGIF